MDLSRRQFLRATAAAGAGLSLAVSLEGCGTEAEPATASGTFAPNAWIRVASDDSVTVMVDRSEMGQGVSTALPMLVAEELDAEWSRVRYEFAPPNKAYYNRFLQGQATGGSTSVKAAWGPLREAGARARAMLIAAAAKQWGVPAAECRTEPSVVVHPGSGRRASYGSLADAAGKEAVPAAVTLKSPAEYRLIGKPIARLDLAEKVTGRAGFGIDARPDGVLVAVVARCPVFGGKVKSFEGAKARAVAGVRQVVQIESGIGIVADSYWQAVKGRNALTVEWNEGDGATVDDASIRAAAIALAAEEGNEARREGDPAGVVPAKTLEAVYEVPYLAHATMEPMNCTAHVHDGGVSVWAPTQFQAGPGLLGGGARGIAAKHAGVPEEKVDLHTTHLGGGFGRRFEMDFVAEAVQLSKAVHAPVKVIWSREDDMRHDAYRPYAYHKLTGGVGGDGSAVLWRHHIVCQSIVAKFFPRIVPRWMTHLAGPLKGGVDTNAIDGAFDVPYAVPNLEVRYSQLEAAVPVGFWRSVGHSHTAFATECFVDELAALAGQDPVAFRRTLLARSPRHLGVLNLAAEKSGWGITALPPGRFRGVAVHESFGSFVAQVAEVSLDGSALRVHRVVCAVDCGIVVNPDTVAAQMEGGIVFGLTAALNGRITIAKGRAKQGNFDDYRMLRMNEVPAIETHIVASTSPPSGVGEPGTPPIAPAVANAVWAATGRRVRSLPIDPAAGPAA